MDLCKGIQPWVVVKRYSHGVEVKRYSHGLR